MAQFCYNAKYLWNRGDCVIWPKHEHNIQRVNFVMVSWGIHSSVSNLNRKSWERIGGLSCASWLYADPSPLGCLDWETEFKVEKLDQNALMLKCIPLMPNAYSLAELVLFTWSGTEQDWSIDELYSHVVTCLKKKKQICSLFTVWRDFTHREWGMLMDAFGDRRPFCTSCRRPGFGLLE